MFPSEILPLQLLGPFQNFLPKPVKELSDRQLSLDEPDEQFIARFDMSAKLAHVEAGVEIYTAYDSQSKALAYKLTPRLSTAPKPPKRTGRGYWGMHPN